MITKQLWTLAVLFFLGSIFFIYDAMIQATSARELLTLNIQMWQAQTIRSAIYGSIGTVLGILAFAFWIAGIFQKTPVQEWAEIEIAKHDVEFGIELSKMPVKEREKFLKEYYKQLTDISAGKKRLDKSVEETKKRVLEKLKKEENKKK